MDQKKAMEVDELTVLELEAWEREIIKMLQEQELGKELTYLKGKQCQKKRKERLWRLNPFVDEEGVLRVGGRLGLPVKMGSSNTQR